MFLNGEWELGAVTVVPCSMFLSLSTPRAEKIPLSVPSLDPLLLALWGPWVDVGFFLN